MRLLINLGLLLCSLFWLNLAIAITPADRVITLSPSATEMAYAAGMGDNIVGVSAYSDYPEDAKSIEQVANWQGINIERILLLKPDLVIAWQGGNPQRPLDQLKALGISIIYSDPQSIEEIADDLITLSSYSHHPDIAIKMPNNYAINIKCYSNNMHQLYRINPTKKCLFNLGCSRYLLHQTVHYKAILLNFVVVKISSLIALWHGLK